MTDRSTRVVAPVRRPRRAVRRTRQSLAVTMMVVGLVAGAFAAPSIAAEGDAGSTVVELAAEGAPQAAPGADESAPQPQAAPVAAAAVDLPPCEEGQIPGIDDCEVVPEVCEDLTDVPPCDDTPPPPIECDPVDADPSTPECDLPIDVPEECPAGTVDNGNGTCVPDNDGGDDGDDGGTGAAPCLRGKDYNGPDKDGCGTKPNNGNNGNGGTGNGTTGNNSGNGSLGSTLGQAEGSVPGSEAATTVTACSDSVICQAAPAATSGSSSTEGLPDTGAAENSRQLLVVGFGLLLAGGLLLKPGRRGRHRLAGAQA